MQSHYLLILFEPTRFCSRAHFSQGSFIPYLLAVSKEAMTRFIFKESRSTPTIERVMSPFMTTPLSKILSIRSTMVSCPGGTCLSDIFAYTLTFHLTVTAYSTVFEPMSLTKPLDVFFCNSF